MVHAPSFQRKGAEAQRTQRKNKNKVHWSHRSAVRPIPWRSAPEGVLKDGNRWDGLGRVRLRGAERHTARYTAERCNEKTTSTGHTALR